MLFLLRVYKYFTHFKISINLYVSSFISKYYHLSKQSQPNKMQLCDFEIVFHKFRYEDKGSNLHPGWSTLIAYVRVTNAFYTSDNLIRSKRKRRSIHNYRWTLTCHCLWLLNTRCTYHIRICYLACLLY